MTTRDYSSRREWRLGGMFNYLISVSVLVALMWTLIRFRRELAALINGGSG